MKYIQCMFCENGSCILFVISLKRGPSLHGFPMAPVKKRGHIYYVILHLSMVGRSVNRVMSDHLPTLIQ